jgi:hypothetical protein
MSLDRRMSFKTGLKELFDDVDLFDLAGDTIMISR